MILLFDFREYIFEMGPQCCLDLQPSARCQRQQSRLSEYKDFKPLAHCHSSNPHCKC